MNVIFKKLIWDKWNENHIKKHQIKPSEVEKSAQVTMWLLLEIWPKKKE